MRVKREKEKKTKKKRASASASAATTPREQKTRRCHRRVAIERRRRARLQRKVVKISLSFVRFSLLSTRKIRAHFSLSLSWFCAFELTLKRGWNVRDDAFAQSGAFGFTSAARQSRAVLSWNCAFARAVSWDTVLYAEWLFSIRRFFYITTGENDKAKVKTKPTVSSIRHDVLLHKFKLFDHDLRYGPTAGLTRRERLELAIANKIGLNENALTVQNAFESKIIDENDPLWKYSVWKNNPGLHVDF